jgi:enoyl-CoA hydratase/carnithine racemase
VTLNRPEALNATNEALHGELAKLWPDLDADAETRAIVLTGAGRAFCGGGDRVPAEDAVRIGIANRVVAAGTSVEAALELAQKIAALPPQAVRETKALMNDAVQRTLDAILERAIVTETASFDESAFQTNLGRMRNRSAR